MRPIAVFVVLLLAGCGKPAGPDQDDPRPDGAPVARACPQPLLSFPFEQTAIQEASGIARSHREPCVFWVHNDSGADPAL